MWEENKGLQGKKEKQLLFSFSLKLPACISLPRFVTALCHPTAQPRGLQEDQV